VQNNITSTVSYCYYSGVVSSPPIYADYNCFYGYSTFAQLTSGNITFANWKTNFSIDTSSIDSNPLFVDASGRVGVGTGSPSSNGLVTIAETTNARLYLADSTVGYDYGAQLRGYGVTGQGGHAELGVVDNNTYSKAITISELANTIVFSRGATERMRLSSTGLLGLGTSTPRGNLDVGHGTGSSTDASIHIGYAAADYFGFRLVNTNTASSTAAGLLKFQRGTTTTWVDSVVIDNSGNVGIGTTAPSAKLDVVSIPVAINQSAVTASFGTGTSTSGFLIIPASLLATREL
jgi:hypothetical protein